MLKKKGVRIALIIISVVILILGGGLAYYRLSRIQGTVSPTVINASLKGETETPHVIIYTQDRAFKNEVISNITDELTDKDIYLEIQPIEELSEDTSPWDKVILFTTIMSSEPPENTLSFINDNKNNEKVAVFLTADSGKWAHQPADVEVLTAASNKDENIDVFTREILNFIENK